MPATVVGTATNYVFSASLPIGTPSSVAAGDRLYAWINAAWNTPVSAAPTGWTLLGSVNQTSGGLGGWWYLYRKDDALTSGDLSASYTWTISASQNHWGAIIAVRGAAAGTNAGGANADFATVVTNNSLTIPAITPTVADTLILAFYSARSTDTTPRNYTHPAGMTEVLDRADNFSGIGIASQTGPAPGVSTGTKTVSRAAGTAAPEWGGVLIAIAPGGNTAPTVNAGADQTGIEPWATVTLTGTDSDSDGTIASRAWTQTSGSPSVVLSGASTATATFEAPGTLAGTTLTFQYSATDNSGATTNDTMTVTVLPVTERAVIGGAEVPMRIRLT